MPLTLDDIPDFNDMSSDDDLPDFGSKCKAKPKPKPTQAKPAQPRPTQAKSKPRSTAESLGKKTVVERLAPSSSPRAARPVAKQRELEPKPKPKPEPEEEEVEVGKDITESDMAYVIEELSLDDQEEMRCQIEQELLDDDFDLPDFRNGDFGTASKKKKKKPLPLKKKAGWSSSTNNKSQAGKATRMGILKKGGEVKSAREKEAEKKEAKEAAVRKSAAPVVKKTYGKTPVQKGYEAQEAQEYEQCGGCGNDIKDQIIRAMNQTWCKRCWVCSGCAKSFPGGAFYRVGTKPYCEPCAKSQQRIANAGR